MENEKEVNTPESLDDTVDKFMDGEQAPPETPEKEASPEKSEPEDKPDDGTDPEKTEDPVDDSDGEQDKTQSVPYSRFQEQVKKRQELEAKWAEAEKSSKLFSGLLDDPSIYRKYLERQGFSKDEISRAMSERGFEEAEQKPSDKPTAQNIAEEVCKDLGWDINRLNADQKAYLNDQIALIDKMFSRLVGPILDQRLKPFEGFVANARTQEKVNKDASEAKRQAKEEFPDLDWEKDIEPAMHRYLDELDKRDPKGKVQIDAITLYERATRQILKEKRVQKDRQEDRDKLKDNARPLKPGAPIPVGDKKLKGKTVGETADAFLDAAGYKN